MCIIYGPSLRGLVSVRVSCFGPSSPPFSPPSWFIKAPSIQPLPPGISWPLPGSRWKMAEAACQQTRSTWSATSASQWNGSVRSFFYEKRGRKFRFNLWIRTLKMSRQSTGMKETSAATVRLGVFKSTFREKKTHKQLKRPAGFCFPLLHELLFSNLLWGILLGRFFDWSYYRECWEFLSCFQ